MGSMSQSEVALRTQISIGYLNRMVRGSVPSEAIIHRFCEALGVEAQSLLEAAGYAPMHQGGDKEDGLGAMAAMQYLRELFDLYIKPVFPEANLPSTAVLPLTGAGIRRMVADHFRDLLEDMEQR